MDIVTLAMAKAYSDSKGGYAEKNVFTWDGNTEGLDELDGYLYRISDRIPDVNTFVRLRGIAGGVEMELTASDCTITEDNGVGWIKFDDTIAAAVVPSGFPSARSGVYFARYNENSVMTYLEFAETIHPIDPKYLPGVCLPVVELETAVTSTQAALSEEDGAQMDTLNGEPAVLKLVAIVNGAEWALRGIAACTNVNGILVYSITSYVEGTLLVLLMNAGNGWVAACNYG